MQLFEIPAKIAIHADTPEQAVELFNQVIANATAPNAFRDRVQFGEVTGDPTVLVVAPEKPAREKKAKLIEFRGLKDKDRIRHGHSYPGKFYPDLNADIVPGKSIRIFGLYSNREFDKTFNLDDSASYGSYNLIYYGAITGITEKGVTITERYDREDKTRHRLSLYEFIWRNYDFDLDEVLSKNHETSMYI